MMASTFARARCAARRSTPATITGWRWRSPSPPHGPPARRRFWVPPLSTYRIRGSSRRAAGSHAVTLDKIFLVGFMAAGKTTVARALAARLGWRAEDVDELIEARERRTVADIFARSGEPYFRAVEREILQLLLPMRHVVVATGGGTFMDPENRSAINLDGVTVWLDVPFEEVLARLPLDGRRPLAADRSQMERLFTTRQLAYAHAHLRVDATGARAEAVAERIMDGITQME